MQSREPESGFKSYLYHCSRLKMATTFLTLFSWRDEDYAPSSESEMTMWQLSSRNIKVILSQFLAQALETDSFHFLCLRAFSHHVKFNYTAVETTWRAWRLIVGRERTSWAQSYRLLIKACEWIALWPLAEQEWIIKIHAGWVRRITQGISTHSSKP